MLILALLFALALLAIATNWRRAQLSVDFSLMPNCLMTRSPLVFVSGLRSPFYFSHYWNRIPLYLREHGYEVLEHDLPWRNTQLRQEDLLLFLEVAQKQSLSFHFIFDSTSLAEVAWLEQKQHVAVKSVFVATPKALALKPQSLWLQQPLQALAVFCHKLYLSKDHGFSPVVLGLASAAPALAAEKEFLRLAISLAEKELKVTDTDRERSRGDATNELHQ